MQSMIPEHQKPAWAFFAAAFFALARAFLFAFFILVEDTAAAWPLPRVWPLPPQEKLQRAASGDHGV